MHWSVRTAVFALSLGAASAAWADPSATAEGTGPGELGFLEAPPFPDLPISDAVRIRIGTLIAPDAPVGRGNVTLVHPELGLRATWPARQDLVLRIALRLAESRYTFHGDVWGPTLGAAPGPTTDPDTLIDDLDLHSVRIALEGAYRLSDSTNWLAEGEQWAVIGSLYGGSRWEDRDFHRGLETGGALGVGYEIPKRLRVALGISLRTTIDNPDLTIGPLVSLRWRPIDRFTLRTRDLGLQGEYALTPALKLFLAGFRSSDTYRLDQRDPLGDLTFRDRQVRVLAGFEWTLANWVHLQLEGGSIIDRHLRVKDEDLGTLLSRHGDPSGYCEIRVEFHL